MAPPKSVLLFGGNGKVARHITTQLAAQHTTVYSVIRNAAQREELAALGATPIVQSIEDSSVADLVTLIQDKTPDAVIWSAGAGGGDPARTSSVDKDGALRVIDAVAQAAADAGTTRRYVTVSALDVRDRESKPRPDWYNDDDNKMSDRVWAVIKAYLEAKYAADKSLVEDNGRRKLEYTIVRPGGLSQDAGTGKVSAGKVRLGKMVSREDVARVVVACLENDGTKGLAFDVAGGDDAVEDAVAKVATEKIDTFEGFH